MLRQLDLIHKVWCPLREACAYGCATKSLFVNFYPTVGIRYRSKGAGVPEEMPVLRD